MDDFEQKVLATIKRHRLIEEGEKVVAAISGGPDSVALLLALKAISEVLHLSVLAAHANHQLRGEESDEDQHFVQDLCSRLETRLESMTVLVRGSHSNCNLENVARECRYDFLAACALREKATLATGHNRNDQAETFLLKMFRGAGPSGLSGIFIKRRHKLSSDSVPVVRPLLEVTREEIVEYLDRKNQAFREDSTNALLHYDRNWIRHQLLPELEQRFNPNITGTLARNAALFAEIEQYLDHLAAALADANIKEEVEGSLLIDLKEFRQVPQILRKQLARIAIRRVKGDLLNIGQNHIEAFLGLCSGTSGRRIDLPGDLRVTREFDNLRIGTISGEVPPFQYDFRPPGELRIAEIQKKLRMRKVSVRAGQSRNLLSSRLNRVTVRNRRPGDHYLISTRSPKKAVKKLFQEKKVPISVRDRLVMLESEGSVIWIEGFPVNPEAAPGQSDLEAFELAVVSETFGHDTPSKYVANESQDSD